MLRLLRQTWIRLAAVVLIVTQLAGFTCYSPEQIYWSPTAGYVVRVEFTEPIVGGTGYRYYAFDSEAAARRFIAQFPPKGLADSEIPGGYTRRLNDLPLDARLALPKAETDQINRTLDRANPPLPSGPVPQ